MFHKIFKNYTVTSPPPPKSLIKAKPHIFQNSDTVTVDQ